MCVCALFGSHFDESDDEPRVTCPFSLEGELGTYLSSNNILIFVDRIRNFL